MLKRILSERIARNGPMRVSEFMREALLHPEHGYYTTRDPFGVKGDFITAPEISQIFGEMIGAWLANVWQEQGSPEGQLIEIGPGRGTLMRDLMRATKNIHSFQDSLELVLVEASPRLCDIQKQTLAGTDARWATGLEEALGKKPLFLVANELLDALPIEQYIMHKNHWHERVVTVNGSRELAFAAGIETSLDIPLQAKGTIYETCPDAEKLVKRVAAHIAYYGGVALFIDYGYAKPAFGETLQAVKSHTYASLLEEPGTADITAHVDFSAMRRAAITAGCEAYVTTQGNFLRSCGAELRAAHLCRNHPPEKQEDILSGLTRLMAPGEMGELFKILAILPTESRTPTGFQEKE